MSLNKIVPENTTSYNYKGVTYYVNPGINAHITSTGKVFNPKTKRFMKESSTGTFTYSYEADNERKYAQASFQSLLSHFFGIKKTVAQIIVPKDKNLGYLEENLEVVENPNKPGPKKGSTYVKRSAKETFKDNPSVKKIPVDVYEKSKEIEIHGIKLIPLYVEHKFICGDGYEVNSRNEAAEHQANIEFAKQCAEVIVNKKLGWSVAEELFLMHMSYTIETKPYSNFKEMYESDKGITEVGSVPLYKFSPNNDLGELKDLLLDESFECDLQTAKQICRSLKEMNEAIDRIINLI